MIKIWENKKYSILKKFLNFGSIAVFLIIFVIPMIVGACGGAGEQPCPGTPSSGMGTPSSNMGTPSSGMGTPPSGVEINTKINNPLGSDLDTIPKFIQALIKVVLYVGVPIVALAIIYTGFLFVSAQGNSEKITKAKKALTYTLIGAALLLGAFVIANALVSTFKEISG